MRKVLFTAAFALLGACSEQAALPVAPDTAAATTTVPGAPAASATPGTAPSDSPSPALDLLHAEGIGAIRFGMTLSQAEQVLGHKAALPTPFDPACSMVRFPTLPGLRFMVENDSVTRADAETGVGNVLGVAVGDTLAQVRDKHPEAELGTHKYDKNGHYLTFPSADGRAAIILEASGGKVTKVRAGLQPAVAYVETCG